MIKKDSLKKVVIFTNFVYFLICCLLIGVGVWILLDRNHISLLFGGSYMLSVGVITTVVTLCCFTFITFLGCCGARREHKCMLMTYFILIVILFLAFLISGTTLLVYQTQLDAELKDEMAETLRRYYGVELEKYYNREVTYAWDKIQYRFECCAIDSYGWFLYRQSRWFIDQPQDDKTLVPESCCKKRDTPEALLQCQYNMVGPPGGNITLYNSALYYKGCYQEAIDWAIINSTVFIVISFCFVLSLILSLWFSICLYRHVAE